VTVPQPFPLSALIGQDALREALLLAAVDPTIGGVLISGPRGTAKSTSARSLADLLPDGHFVTLPLGASEDRVVGTLDLDAVLRGGEVKFSPGLLARAHNGVLYVDEVNLLADGLVDVVLDAAASAINVVERDGVSHSHAARFVLIGTMNPEEGELRPQLLDRFGLMVQLENCFDPQLRQQIVRTRMAFDLDPDAFRERHAAAQSHLAQQIRLARAALPQLSFDDDVHDAVSARCIEARVDGLRADLVMLRAARALAAPRTRISTNLVAPSPSFTTCSARSSNRSSSAFLKARSAGSLAEETAGLPARPVANSISVSLVEVSLSTVMQLKLLAVPVASNSCSTGAGMAASVKT
jgi:magnesium chelatase subunit I